MNAKPFWIHDDTAATAFDSVLRAVQGALDTAAAERAEAQFKREIARLHSLPRATQKNESDTCADCGAEAWHTSYRNGRAIGLCDDCYGG